MVRTLRAETGSEHGTAERVADRYYKAELIRGPVRVGP
jgi:hypothetical protein